MAPFSIGYMQNVMLLNSSKPNCIHIISAAHGDENEGLSHTISYEITTAT